MLIKMTKGCIYDSGDKSGDVTFTLSYKNINQSFTGSAPKESALQLSAILNEVTIPPLYNIKFT